MSELDQVLSRLRGHPGVQQVVLLGRDGLLVRQTGEGAGIEPDVLAAMVPDVASTCATLGHSGDPGEFATAVVEYAAGVVIIVSLPDELLLALVLRSDVGFAPLLREVRAERARLVALL